MTLCRLKETCQNLASIFLACVVLWGAWLFCEQSLPDPVEFDNNTSVNMEITITDIDKVVDEVVFHSQTGDDIVRSVNSFEYYIVRTTIGEDFIASKELIEEEQLVIGETYLMNIQLWEHPARIRYIIKHIEKPKIVSPAENPRG